MWECSICGAGMFHHRAAPPNEHPFKPGKFICDDCLAALEEGMTEDEILEAEYGI